MSKASRPVFTKTFEGAGAFDALNAAQDWLAEKGYSYGSTSVDGPAGILYGDWNIAKWRNLSSTERAQLDGQLDGNTRNGPITVFLFDGRQS